MVKFKGLTSGKELEARGLEILGHAVTPGDRSAGASFLSIAIEAYRKEGDHTRRRNLNAIRLNALGSREIGLALVVKERRADPKGRAVEG